MAEGASIGEVHVDVSPRLGDWARFRAEMLAQGTKVGDDLGAAMGKRIADQIAKGVRDGLSGSTARAEAARGGAESGRAFADGFKRRVEAALKSLPKVNVDADTSPADRQIAQLRAALAEVGSRSPNVQVRADTAGAAAQLAAFNAEVDRIDGRTATVNVDTSRAVGNISNLIAAGIAIGPALVPAAAAATAAIAGIGPAAVGAVGGLSVAALAMVGVSNALEAMQRVEDAATKGAAAQATANKKLAESLKDLSPAGREFAEFVFALKAPLLDLRRTAEAGLLPGVEDGIKSMLTVLPTALTLVGRFSTSVGNLARSAGAAFAQPYWVNFATDLTSTAIPAMENFAHVAYNLAIGVSGLVHAFLPLSGDIGGGLLKFSRDFAAYGLTLENTAGYRAFLDYVRTVGPEVVQTVSEVARAIIRIVQAAAPVGGVTLTAIRLLAEAINSLPIPVLTALVAGIVGVTTASKGLTLAKDLWFSAYGVGFVQMMTNAKTAMSLAGTQGAGKLVTAASGARAAIGTLASSVGPLGVGLAAGTLLISAWANHHADAAAKIAKHKSAVDEINGAIKANSGLVDENVRKIAAKNAYDQGALQLAQKTGISLGEITNAYIRGGTSIDGIVSKLDAYITAEQRATQTDQDHSTQHTTNIKNARELIGILGGQKDAVANNTAETAKATDKQRILDEAMKGVGATTLGLTPQQIALGQALRTVSDASSTAADRANALKAADDAVFGAARNAITAEQDQALVLLQVAAAGKANADQQLFGKATLDLHSEASIRNRQMLEQRFLALGQQYLADVQSGMALDQAKAKHDTNRDAIIKAAEAAHFDAGEVHKLADTFGTLPTDPKVVVTVAGVGEAYGQLQKLQIAQYALKYGIAPDVAVKEFQKSKQSANSFLGAGGLATGGRVAGPGGPTDDKIPAWLSNGEHVITAREVQAAGGHGAIEEIRRMLLGRRQPQALYPGDGSGGLKFARGGAVQWPFPATAGMTKIPSLADIQRAALFGPNYTGSLSGSLEAAVAFVQHQVGKPYVWASAGPYGYDCSGIVSAAWNVAHGRNPYSHTFSTMNEAPYFPIGGYGPFTAAWTNPGESGVGGGPGGVGHTAARIGNFAFESVGGQGVRSGSGVTALGRFAHIGHYDSGGILPPGLTIARNDTGTNEFVFTGDQLASIGGRGATINQHIYPQRGQSEPEIAAAASRQLAWELK